MRICRQGPINDRKWNCGQKNHCNCFHLWTQNAMQVLIKVAHTAAKGVRQKEFGKKVSKKVTEASEKKWSNSFCRSPCVTLNRKRITLAICEILACPQNPFGCGDSLPVCLLQEKKIAICDRHSWRAKDVQGTNLGQKENLADLTPPPTPSPWGPLPHPPRHLLLHWCKILPT